MPLPFGQSTTFRCGQSAGATSLDRPGDYCLVCHTANTDAVVLELDRERATVTSLLDGSVVGQRTVTTTPEGEGSDETVVVELRNVAGLVADEVRRTRPEEVYVTGDRDVIAAVRPQLHTSSFASRATTPSSGSSTVRASPPRVVDAAPAENWAGATRRSSAVGRASESSAVAGHPHVKKVIPGPIDAGGASSPTGVRAKATRADANGNVRVLIRDGSSVQENRVVTTAGDRELGEHVRADLNEALGKPTAGVAPAPDRWSRHDNTSNEHGATATPTTRVRRTAGNDVRTSRSTRARMECGERR